MATLYVVGTPIGNLDDITLRALSVLKEADFILCEDTRVTAKLLHHYGIDKPTISYHQHSKLKKVEDIIKLLEQGRSLALVSDAGTPGISDPGNKLIEEAVKRFGAKADVVTVPGPSAVTAALSVCGFPTDNFLFLGFPPAKRKRRRFFQKIIDSEYLAVFYESPHRVIKTLQEIDNLSKKNLRVVVCRELTKKFETLYRGNIPEVISQFGEDQIRGEFVVIIDKNRE